jgi:hypothetical protein
LNIAAIEPSPTLASVASPEMSFRLSSRQSIRILHLELPAEGLLDESLPRPVVNALLTYIAHFLSLFIYYIQYSLPCTLKREQARLHVAAGLSSQEHPLLPLYLTRRNRDWLEAGLFFFHYDIIEFCHTYSTMDMPSRFEYHQPLHHLLAFVEKWKTGISDKNADEESRKQLPWDLVFSTHRCKPNSEDMESQPTLFYQMLHQYYAHKRLPSPSSSTTSPPPMEPVVEFLRSFIRYDAPIHSQSASPVDSSTIAMDLFHYPGESEEWDLIEPPLPPRPDESEAEVENWVRYNNME